MIFVDQVAEYLEDQGLGTVSTDIFVGRLPASPDSCIAVINTGGTSPSIDIPDKTPTFQVLVRNTSYEAGENKLAAVRAALHQFQNSTLVTGQTYVYYIYAISEGGHIGLDESGRDEFSINFQCKTR